MSKSLPLSIISFFILFCFISIASADWQKSNAQLEMEKLFQSNAEKTAKDALWTARDMFKVGVIDDGSLRDGYAMYVCEVLREYGLSAGTRVQIIDIVRLTRNGKWMKLGEAKCD